MNKTKLNFKEYYNREVNYMMCLYGETREEAKKNIDMDKLKEEYKEYVTI